LSLEEQPAGGTQEPAMLMVEAARLARELAAVLTTAEALGAALLVEIEQYSLADKTVTEVSVKSRS
jgi:hypothetical protein